VPVLGPVVLIGGSAWTAFVEFVRNRSHPSLRTAPTVETVLLVPPWPGVDYERTGSG
jgi:hypothetical protein